MKCAYCPAPNAQIVAGRLVAESGEVKDLALCWDCFRRRAQIAPGDGPVLARLQRLEARERRAGH